MKGKLTVEVDGKTVHSEGHILFSDSLEPYYVLTAVAKCLGITTTEQFARLAVVANLHKATGSEKFEQTKIVIPRKPEDG